MDNNMLDKIRGLKGVREAALRSSAEGNHLRVTTNPLVIESPDGVRFLVPSLTFDLHESTGTYVSLWEVIKWQDVTGKHPHPSFMYSGPSYGKATQPISEAIARGDWFAAVFLILGFLSSWTDHFTTTNYEGNKVVRHAKGWVV